MRPDSTEYLDVTDGATGQTYDIDLAAGYRGLALSPDGHVLVAARAGNLYRFTLP